MKERKMRRCKGVRKCENSVNGVCTERVTPWCRTLHVKIVALVKAATFGPMGVAWLLDGQLFSQPLVLGGVRAGNVGLWGARLSGGGAGRRLVLLRLWRCGDNILLWDERVLNHTHDLHSERISITFYWKYFYRFFFVL